MCQAEPRLYWYYTSLEPVCSFNNRSVYSMPCLQTSRLIVNIYAPWDTQYYPVTRKLEEIAAWVQSQYKDGLFRYGDSHVKDTTVARPSYLEHGGSFYWWDDVFMLRRPPVSSSTCNDLQWYFQICLVRTQSWPHLIRIPGNISHLHRSPPHCSPSWPHFVGSSTCH